jgi:hypothetical protein
MVMVTFVFLALNARDVDPVAVGDNTDFIGHVRLYFDLLASYWKRVQGLQSGIAVDGIAAKSHLMSGG